MKTALTCSNGREHKFNIIEFDAGWVEVCEYCGTTAPKHCKRGDPPKFSYYRFYDGFWELCDYCGELALDHPKDKALLAVQETRSRLSGEDDQDVSHVLYARRVLAG